MNPAALKADLHTVERGGTVILNEDAFTQRNIEKAGYAADPRQDGTLEGFQLFEVPMTSITVRATEEIGIGKKEAERAKNMFALGLVSWMFGRPTETTLNWLERKFGSKQEIFEANVAAFKAGYNFGETTELFAQSYRWLPPRSKPGPIATSRGRRRCPGVWSRPPSAADSRCSTPATRSPRPPSCCTSSAGTRTSASSRCRPRTRSRPRTWRWARPSPATSR